MTVLILWWVIGWLYLCGAFLAAILCRRAHLDEGRGNTSQALLSGLTWPLWTPVVLVESLIATIREMCGEGKP